MADTPEQRIAEMSIAVTDAINRLAGILYGLPVPIKLQGAETPIPHQEFQSVIERNRTLIEDEPIPGHAIAHLDFAVLQVLAAMDLVALAVSTQIGWRYDAVMLACDTAQINFNLVEAILNEDLE